MSDNGRLIPCRFPDFDEMEGDKPKYYITLPALWTGKHADIEAAAIKATKAEQLEGKHATFAVSIALLDDYCLPGMTAKKWDFNELPLTIISWVNTAVYGDYMKAQVVEKKFLQPLEIG